MLRIFDNLVRGNVFRTPHLHCHLDFRETIEIGTFHRRYQRHPLSLRHVQSENQACVEVSVIGFHLRGAEEFSGRLSLCCSVVNQGHHSVLPFRNALKHFRCHRGEHRSADVILIAHPHDEVVDGFVHGDVFEADCSGGLFRCPLFVFRIFFGCLQHEANSF